jgi:hypothetical protein
MKTTIDMAREAGIIDFRDAYSEEHVQAVLQDLKRFEALVRAAERDKWMERAHIMILGEREACAKVVEALEGCAQYFPHVPDIIRNRRNTWPNVNTAGIKSTTAPATDRQTATGMSANAATRSSPHY